MNVAAGRPERRGEESFTKVNETFSTLLQSVTKDTFRHGLAIEASVAPATGTSDDRPAR